MRVMRIDDAIELIRMEYAELPGLKLTFWQAQRLWDLSDDVCSGALNTLTESRFLVRSVDGAYARPVWSAAARRASSDRIVQNDPRAFKPSSGAA
jgi:hypothetical protein